MHPFIRYFLCLLFIILILPKPRLVNLLRIFKFIFLSWLCLIGLWIFLPSFTIPEDNYLPSGQYSRYIHRKLTAGSPLHTIFRWDPSFSADSVTFFPPGYLFPGSPRQPKHVSGPPDECPALLIDWRLVSSPAHDPAVMLEMGRDFRVKLDLTDAVAKLNVSNDENDNDSGNGLPNIYLSDQITVQVDVGSEDHIINLPWFHWADAALFHNHMHGMTHNVDLRLVALRHQEVEATDTIIVEIWKAAPVIEWEQKKREQAHRKNQFMYLPNEGDGVGGDDSNDIVDIFKSASHRSKGVLASFSNIPSPSSPAQSHKTTIDLSQIHVSNLHADLPSKTYAIRSLILIPLAPTVNVVWLVFYLLIFLVGSEVLTLLSWYCITVLICWLWYCVRYRRQHKGSPGDQEKGYMTGDMGEIKRMTFIEWFSSFWLTKHVYAVLAYCCCCCPRRRGFHRSEEKKRGGGGGKKGIVIWGPSGPIYEE